MKELKQITVIGMGLLGGSITLTALRALGNIKAIGYSHRPATRQKARQSEVATEIADDIKLSVAGSDLVILATPIFTFEGIFDQIADSLKKGCIVTDVGSTKLLPHRWAAKKLPKAVHYVGSHPIAGSEQRGIDCARDDLFDQATCILTKTKTTNAQAVKTLKKFWSDLGCSVKLMTPADHDKTYAKVSHLPHITAAALINANDQKTLNFAGKGFIDTTRIASGQPNIWADIILTNNKNITKGIDKLIAELQKLKKAIESGNANRVQTLLKNAREKRGKLINRKIKDKDVI